MTIIKIPYINTCATFATCYEAIKYCQHYVGLFSKKYSVDVNADGLLLFTVYIRGCGVYWY